MQIYRGERPQDLLDFHFIPKEVVRIEQGDWRHGRGEFITLNVATCVAMAAHNLEARNGLLGHFSTISPLSQREERLKNEHFDTVAFSEAINAIPLLGPAEATQIWLGGAAVYTDYGESGERVAVQDRVYATEAVTVMMQANGMDQQGWRPEWSGDNEELAIHLNANLGMLFIGRIIDIP